MKRSLMTICFSVLLALIGSGCTTVGPDYKPPTAPVGENWLDYKDPLLDETPPVEPEWWKSAFNDPTLDRLVEIALSQNFTLRSAGLRVLQARQQLAIVIGSQYPQQQEFTGSVSPKKLSGNAKDHFPLLEDRFAFYNLGFNLSWEADVWGRFKRQIESASAAFESRLQNSKPARSAHWMSSRPEPSSTTPRLARHRSNSRCSNSRIRWQYFSAAPHRT